MRLRKAKMRMRWRKTRMRMRFGRQKWEWGGERLIWEWDLEGKNENEVDKDETKDSKWDLIWTISDDMTHNLVCMPDIAVCVSLNAHSVVCAFKETLFSKFCFACPIFTT